VVFGYGAKFPAKYQDALFMCDWSFGKLYALHLTPDGSSYVGKAEEFVSGQPLPLTDVVINSVDGAMYFLVGGRRTQSALYRVTYTGKESTAPAPISTLFREERELRRMLEAFHGHADPNAVSKLWPYLNSKDRGIRYAARVALEWQDAKEWTQRALTEKDTRSAIAALIALIRVSARDQFHRQSSDAPPTRLCKRRFSPDSTRSTGRASPRAIVSICCGRTR
jgi:hypothetical protein